MTTEAKKPEGGNGEKTARAVSTAGRSAHPLFGNPRGDFDQLFNRFLGRGWMTPRGGLSGLWDFPSMPAPSTGLREALTLPQADVSETDSEYEITVDLPGMDEKDIDVSLTDDAIVLKGEKKSEKETKEKEFHLTERSFGSFKRSFSLPADVDRKGVKATFSKGVLTVHLPKSQEADAKPQKIEVKGS